MNVVVDGIEMTVEENSSLGILLKYELGKQMISSQEKNKLKEFVRHLLNTVTGKIILETAVQWEPNQSWTVKDLAEKAGLTEKTIRAYIRILGRPATKFGMLIFSHWQGKYWLDKKMHKEIAAQLLEEQLGRPFGE